MPAEPFVVAEKLKFHDLRFVHQLGGRKVVIKREFLRLA